jgi:hypothetical protein
MLLSKSTLLASLIARRPVFAVANGQEVIALLVVS